MRRRRLRWNETERDIESDMPQMSGSRETGRQTHARKQRRYHSNSSQRCSSRRRQEQPRRRQETEAAARASRRGMSQQRKSSTSQLLVLTNKRDININCWTLNSSIATSREKVPDGSAQLVKPPAAGDAIPAPAPPGPSRGPPAPGDIPIVSGV